MNILLLMMGGSGVRFGANVPKQFILINDRPIFSYIMEKYNQMNAIDKIIIVSHGNWISYVEEWKERCHSHKVEAIVEGGNSRSESVRNGLRAAMKLAQREDVVLIHDATHPYVDIKGTELIIENVKQYGAATLGGCQYDTCYQIDAQQNLVRVIPRAELVSGASPEAFLLGTIYDIYENSPQEELDTMTSAGAIALAHNINMKVVPANVLNLKITYPGDMTVFEQLVDSYFFNPNEK